MTLPILSTFDAQHHLVHAYSYCVLILSFSEDVYLNLRFQQEDEEF
jgi:hypothetical protein